MNCGNFLERQIQYTRHPPMLQFPLKGAPVTFDAGVPITAVAALISGKDPDPGDILSVFPIQCRTVVHEADCLLMQSRNP